MSDPEAIPKIAADPTPPKLQLPRGWLILTGALVLLWLITWIVGIIHLSQADARYTRDLHEAVKLKGAAIARSLEVVDSSFLSDDGQSHAQAFFNEQFSDPNLKYIVFLDQSGNVRTTSDNSLTRDNKPETVTQIVVHETGSNGADIEVLGPIKSVGGQQIGSVRIGLQYKTARNGK